MPLVLLSPSGDRRFALPEQTALVLGREATCDVPLRDQGVSRRHAELRADGTRLRVADLGSRNGTWLNGQRVTSGTAAVGDRLAFGPVEFTLGQEDAPRAPVTAPFALDGAATMVRERPMPAAADAVEAVAGRRLAQLVALTQRLGALEALDDLLARIVDDTFAAFAADRVAVLLVDDAGELVARVARDRGGSPIARPVSRSIAREVAEKQVSWLLHDARQDARVDGQSVTTQIVRSALAAPLLGEDRRTLGVVYADNLRDVRAFSEADLDFLAAYASVAAAALERERSASRLREASRIRENFARYFTPQLAERIAATTGDVALGGDRRPVVVLFSDIRGFTEVAESLPPDAMAAQLNEYFGAMVECVFRHEGALDKYIGDALMAYWGAPVAREDDASRAVAAAVDMHAALAALNARWAREGRPVLAAGIGLHTGEAFVGNIGAPQRLEYTLIGDTVNLASRLCALAGGGEVLVSDAVRARLDAGWVLAPRPDVVPARHRGPAVAVHAVHTRAPSSPTETATTPVSAAAAPPPADAEAAR